MESQVIHQNRIRQIFFLIIISLLGILLFRELYFLFPALLGAITLYIIMRKPYLYLVMKQNWHRVWAAVLFMIVSLLVILFPIAALIKMLSSKVNYAVGRSNELVASMKTVLKEIEQQFGLGLISTENINKLSGALAETLPKILNATFNTLGTIFFMYFILYFMLVKGKQMEKSIYEHIPLKDENVKKLEHEVHNMVMINALVIPLIAILQGIVGLIGYFIIGVHDPWFWFVVTCITAMLPVVGAALAYVPLAIIFFANNQDWQGVFMLIYGFGVIGTVDNVFRFTLAKKIGNVHPLITVFGVIIGLQLFGFIGLIFGPMLISLFILLLNIYSSEFITKRRNYKLTK